MCWGLGTELSSEAGLFLLSWRISKLNPFVFESQYFYLTLYLLIFLIIKYCTLLGFQNLRNGVLVMLWQACNLLSRFPAIFWVLAIWGIISVRMSLQGYKSHVRCHLLVNEELLHVYILRSWNWKKVGQDKTWGVRAVAWNFYLVIWWEHKKCRKCFNSP